MSKINDIQVSITYLDADRGYGFGLGDGGEDVFLPPAVVRTLRATGDLNRARVRIAPSSRKPGSWLATAAVDADGNVIPAPPKTDGPIEPSGRDDELTWDDAKRIARDVMRRSRSVRDAVADTLRQLGGLWTSAAVAELFGLDQHVATGHLAHAAQTGRLRVFRLGAAGDPDSPRSARNYYSAHADAIKPALNPLVQQFVEAKR